MNKQFMLSYLKARINEIKWASSRTECSEHKKGRIVEVEKLIKLISRSKKS